jgi:hypothetical protein
MSGAFGSQGTMSRATLEQILVNMFGEVTGRKMIKDLGANPSTRPFASKGDINESQNEAAMRMPVLPGMMAFEDIFPEGGPIEEAAVATKDYMDQQIFNAELQAQAEEFLKQPGVDEVVEETPDTYGGWWGSGWGGGGGGSSKKWTDWFRNMYWNVG